ncbi:MAG: flavin monoamine oxidase family protein [Bdellovibrionota bacterium]
MNSSRRRFLRLALAATVLPRFSLAASLGAPRKKVLILGAGMAGISAAQLLRDKADVLILEARDRIGGRIHTQRRSDGTVIEHGANWLHSGNTNPLVPLCRDLQIPTVESDNWSSIVRATRHGLVSPEMQKKLDREFDEQVKRLVRATPTGKPSLGQVVRNIILPGLGNTEKKNFLHTLRTDIEDDYGDDIDKIDFAYWQADPTEEGFDRLIPGGYDTLVNRLAEGTPILTGKAIDTVKAGPRGVVVYAGKERWSADHVIITAPVGVLKAGVIRFDPPLPAWKAEAIQRIGFGTFEKAFMTVREVTWGNENSWFDYFDDDPMRLASLFNLAKYEPNSRAVIGLDAGDSARRWAAEPDKVILARVKAAMQPFARAPFEMTDFFRTRWHSDPFTRGAYSYPAATELAGDRERLRESVHDGRVLFAGEATELDQVGTVHAAYLSGRAAAREILKKI